MASLSADNEKMKQREQEREAEICTLERARDSFKQ